MKTTMITLQNALAGFVLSKANNPHNTSRTTYELCVRIYIAKRGRACQGVSLRFPNPGICAKLSHEPV